MTKKKQYVVCNECGLRVHGISINQAKSMLPAHRRSKIHKKLILQKKEDANDRK